MKHVIIFMFLSNSIFGQNTDMKSELLSRINNASDYTIKVLNLMPESLLSFRPRQGTRSFAEIIQHIGEAQLYTASQGIQINQIKFNGDLAHKKELEAFVEESYNLLYSTVNKISTDDLMKKVSFWDGKSSVFKILNFTIDHATHHRGQATVYLRLNNIKPPDYIGW